jgi:hypothetical protein
MSSVPAWSAPLPRASAEVSGQIRLKGMFVGMNIDR